MIWVLEVLEGSRQGSTFKLFPGLSIGRKHADINLDDGKISNIHAVLEEDSEGRVFLVDNKSRNGIYVGENRVNEVELVDGLEVSIGRTLVRIAKVEENQGVDYIDTSETWQTVLGNFNHQLSLSSPQTIKEIHPMTPVIELEFIRGQQTSTKWTLGYGPRQIGAHAIDMPIHEEDAPGICFEIHPDEPSPAFHCSHPKKVKINNQSKTQKTLRPGDEISIGETLIKVHFINV